MAPSKVQDKLINFASEIDAPTLDQARQTASMPFVHPHIALMPDAHFGKGSSVGTVIPTIDAVIPAAVGVDIGCGMGAVRTRLSAGDIADLDLAVLRQMIEDAIPMAKGCYNDGVDRFPFTQPRIDTLTELANPGTADARAVDLSHSPNWPQQLGSLGGGNHFIELCLDEVDRVWLFLHSGSRGVGNRIAQRHIKVAQQLCKQWWIDLPNADLAYLPQGTPEFGVYLRELNWAQRFALENRAEMMDRFLWAFASWTAAPGRQPIDDPAELVETVVNTHHNYTVKETHGGRDVWVTRKGAIAAHDGMLGLIPGSMGTRSYVVRGKGFRSGLCSAPHGAGRRYSRTKARQLFTADDLAARMTGIEFRQQIADQLVDEIPDAYKPIDQVIEDAGLLVEVVHTLRQILNVKGA